MTPIIPSLSPLFEFQLPRNISGTDFGTGYGGTVCDFHTRPSESNVNGPRLISIVNFTSKGHRCILYNIMNTAWVR